MASRCLSLGGRLLVAPVLPGGGRVPGRGLGGRGALHLLRLHLGPRHFGAGVQVHEQTAVRAQFGTAAFTPAERKASVSES